MACKDCKKKKNLKQWMSNVIEGNWNRVTNNPAVEQLANERRAVCEGCDHRVIIFTVDTYKEYGCSVCWCPIESKIRSKGESCPMSKW
jgi:DNA-directed RNA polymerase subunit RPC12/RpoP